MITVIRALFWLWVLTSVVILTYRAVRKVSNRGSTDSPPPARDQLLTFEDPLRTATPLPPLGDLAAPPPDTLTTPSESMLPGVAPVVPPDGGSIFDPDTSSTAARPPGGSRPLAELVVGIQMPCDLAPLLDQVPRPGTRESVSFSTRGHSAVDVGRAVGDELRRLGFDLEPVTAMRVRATKDDGALEVEVHPDATTVEHSGMRAYPNTSPGTVAVEIWR